MPKNFPTKKIGIVLIILVIIAAVIFILIPKDNDKNNNVITNIINQSQSLPEFSEFVKNPSDTFIIKPEDYSKITRATPQYGKSLQCAHPGGHIHFTAKGAPYETEIISPVDGYVSMVDKCFNLGSGSGSPQDKFGISIAFAKYKGNTVSFGFSIEPFSGQLCVNNPDYYLQYILVKNGEKVKKGQVIARMPKLSTKDDSTHVHFNLNMDGSDTPICPNIFTSQIEKDFLQMNDSPMKCGSESVPATFCFKPSAGEDLTQ